MDLTFTNGTVAQQQAVTEATTRLLNLDLGRFPHRITITFSSTVAGDGYAHSTVNGTQVSCAIRDDALSFSGAETDSLTPDEQRRFLRELVVREIGRGLILSMMEPEQQQIADIFGIPTAAWQTGEWASRPIEGIAETFKAAFLPQQHRMFHNRTQVQLSLRLYPKFRSVFRQTMQFGEELIVAEQPIPVQIRVWTTDLILPEGSQTLTVDPPFDIGALWVVTLGIRSRPWSFGSVPGDIRQGYSMMFDGTPTPMHNTVTWDAETRFARPRVSLFSGSGGFGPESGPAPSAPLTVTFGSEYHNFRAVLIATPWTSPGAPFTNSNNGLVSSSGGTFLSGSNLDPPVLGVAAQGVPIGEKAVTQGIDLVNNAYLDDDRFYNPGNPGECNEVIQMVWGENISLRYQYSKIPEVNGTYAAVYRPPTNKDDIEYPVVDVDGQEVPPGSLATTPGTAGNRAAIRPVIGTQ